MRFEIKLAYRHLVSGGGQTALTVAAVAIAVTVIIFIQSLITGVQRRFINDLVGSQPHVTVKRPDPAPDSLARAAERTGGEVPGVAPGAFLATREEKQVQQRTDIEQWKQVETQLAQFPGVRTVTSAVRGNAFLIRGAKRLGVTVSGGDPAAQEKIVGLQEDMIAGSWLEIGPDDVVIGWRLADEAGVRLGDRVTLQSPEGVSASFRVAGLFDTGNNTADLGQAFLTLRAAQSLFATRQDVSSILVKLDDPFQANAVADQIAAALPFETESWMREQVFIMNALRSQDQSRLMICMFALLASAFGIASVLIVSVVQKSRQIGILKSMGARDRQILLVFTLEGLGIALMGCLVGSGLGALLLNALAQIPQTARFGKADKLFNIAWDAEIFLGACAAAVAATLIAAILPARRAATMNPVDVIRGG
jgi:ABC-type transport system, involved in lipoprotein release, permease component